MTQDAVLRPRSYGSLNNEQKARVNATILSNFTAEDGVFAQSFRDLVNARAEGLRILEGQDNNSELTYKNAQLYTMTSMRHYLGAALSNVSESRKIKPEQSLEGDIETIGNRLVDPQYDPRGDARLGLARQGQEWTKPPQKSDPKLLEFIKSEMENQQRLNQSLSRGNHVHGVAYHPEPVAPQTPRVASPRERS